MDDLVGIDSKRFVGWFDAFQLYGLAAVNAGSNIARISRSQTHARRDGFEDYGLIFQLTGRSGLNLNDTLLKLEAGELVLADPTRPMTVFNEPGIVQHMALHLPREQLVAHLGFEPKGALHRRGSAANRLLIQLMVEASRKYGASDPLPEGQMQLVVFDLLAALFSPPGDERGSAYTDKLFARVCEMIRARLADPELTPAAVATEARISMRYLQKLFGARGTTCSHFIRSARLDKASRLLQRRALSGGETPLGEIALACGFLDYAHFSRRFRQRFGHTPSAHSAVRGNGAGLDRPY